MLDVWQRPGCLSVAVSEVLVHRTLLILDTLVGEFEKRGATVSPVSALEWIAWAKQYVDWVDALKKGFDISELQDS
jgi:hypothetical protein